MPLLSPADRWACTTLPAQASYLNSCRFTANAWVLTPGPACLHCCACILSSLRCLDMTLIALQELLFPEHHPYQHVIRNVVIQMGRVERAVLCSNMLDGRSILM